MQRKRFKTTITRSKKKITGSPRLTSRRSKTDEFKDAPLDMLRKNSNMWSGRLGIITASEHRISFNQGECPSHKIPYRHGPYILEDTVKHMQD